MSSPSSTTPALYEFSWWAFTLVLAGLMLLPIYTQTPDFPFFVANTVYIIVAITLTRYFFFLKISWLRDRLLLQGILSLLLILLIFWMVQSLNAFIRFFDDYGPDVLVKGLSKDTAGIMKGYIEAEFRFFGIWAIITALLTPPRMIYNVWSRYRAGVRTL
ncbi:MAG: hypothetical protein ACI81P_003392 [Neolewinella sp.]|jgi:hypothetical protein